MDPPSKSMSLSSFLTNSIKKLVLFYLRKYPIIKANSKINVNKFRQKL